MFSRKEEGCYAQILAPVAESRLRDKSETSRERVGNAASPSSCYVDARRTIHTFFLHIIASAFAEFRTTKNFAISDNIAR